MKRSSEPKIVIVGCGNLAWHLAKKFRKLAYSSITIYNHRQNEQLLEFKKKLKCKVVVGTDEIIGDADLYFICVSDKAISRISKKIEISNAEAILIHNSGSMAIEILGNPKCSTGVFYPLQSFSKNDEINWKEIPILLEGNSKEAEKRLTHLAKQMSKTVRIVKYGSRLRMHLAAVIVNNFTNSLYVEAEQLLTEDPKLKFKWLLPLMEKTTTKLKSLAPRAAQTGPARRGDNEVIKKHLNLISKQKTLLHLYKTMNSLIDRQQN